MSLPEPIVWQCLHRLPDELQQVALDDLGLRLADSQP